MTRKTLFFVAPALLLLGLSGWVLLDPVATRGDDRRIVDERFLSLEKELGRHLYAPTWLPHGGRSGTLVQGARRILHEFPDTQDRSLVIVSQEPRTAERDRYHERIFENRAEARVMVGDKPGFLVTGSSGERRLFWNEPDMAVIVSSTVLSDEELVKVASRVE